MSAVHPRRTSQEKRPGYLPTAVQERLNRPILPSDTLNDWDRRRLAGRGIDRASTDTLNPDVVVMRVELPVDPVPPTPIRTYSPNKPGVISGRPAK